MTLFKIKLESPIVKDEVIRLKSELLSAEKHDLLIIDTGTYNFISTDVFKYFKAQLSDLEPCLNKFKRIALIQTPAYENETTTPERYSLFTSLEEATEWYLHKENKL